MINQGALDNFLQDLGINDLTDDKKTSLLLDIGRIIQQNVIIRVLDELKEEDKNEFEKLLESKANDQQAILSFLQSKIPNLDAIVGEEIDNFKSESKEVMSATGE